MRRPDESLPEDDSSLAAPRRRFGLEDIEIIDLDGEKPRLPREDEGSPYANRDLIGQILITRGRRK